MEDIITVAIWAFCGGVWSANVVGAQTIKGKLASGVVCLVSVAASVSYIIQASSL